MDMRKRAEGCAHVKPLPTWCGCSDDRRSTEVEIEAVDVDTNPHGRPRLLMRSDGTDLSGLQFGTTAHRLYATLATPMRSETQMLRLHGNS
jgi:hypothetical protein